jgi:ribonuclease HI
MAEQKKEKIMGRVTAYCDGGSRGNPGPAGYGVFVQAEDGSPLAELSEFLGVRTNNVAEYQGLLAALHWAVENGAEGLRVVSDSELMVKQIKGQYSVKSPDLKPLYEEAKRRIARLDRFEMQHVLRGKNKEADRLANEAMDRGMGRGPDKLKDPAVDRLAPRPAPAAPRPKPAAAAAPMVAGLPAEVTGFVKNGVVHLVEGELPEGTFVRILPARR